VEPESPKADLADFVSFRKNYLKGDEKGEGQVSSWTVFSKHLGSAVSLRRGPR
jgi:hypothetical protein